MQSYFKSLKNPVYYIAEIGGNHEGDYTYAKELTRLAIKSGADAIKFQLYTGDTLVSRVESPDRNSHFKKFELDTKDYFSIAKYCIDNGVEFMASVWDAELLNSFNPRINIHKVGSGDLTCYPLIKMLVETKKPIILSTGLSAMQEVADVVRYIESLDKEYISDKKLALLQCTSSYPTPDEDANINAMIALRDEFNLPVGYSDHTIGTDAIEVAVALGAEIIEKHFTDCRDGKEFRDHKVSLTTAETSGFLNKAKKIQTLLGRKEKYLTESEKQSEHHISFRRSIYAAMDIRKGEMLSEDNLTYLRPAHGVSACQYDELIGKVTKKDIKCYEVVRESDIT